jgi:hypothetical protein
MASCVGGGTVSPSLASPTRALKRDGPSIAKAAIEVSMLDPIRFIFFAYAAMVTTGCVVRARPETRHEIREDHREEKHEEKREEKHERHE